MVNNLFVYLETQKQINFNNIKIYQPSLNDILDYDIEKYNILLLPFLLDIDDFEIQDKSAIENISMFEILLLNKDTFSFLLNSLSYFCHTDKISLDEQKGNLYIGDGYINKENFADFANIILQINAKQKPKKEKPPENMTQKQKSIWEKLQKGRQRQAEKAQIDLADLINTCQFGGEYYIPIEDISKMTLYNISRCYKTILGKSIFNESFEIYCVTGEEKLIKNRHWTDLIKVNNNKEEIL